MKKTESIGMKSADRFGGNNFQYTADNLRRLQLMELKILIELDRICRKYHIHYIIDAGTLLGAVRHGGFIPWDDDIDVRMLRQEYERFCLACEEELGREFFLQTYKSDPGYRWGFARILLRGTRFERDDQRPLRSRTGIFIDIFPCDRYSERGILRWILQRISWLIRKGLYSEVGVVQAKTPLSRFGFRLLNLLPKKCFYALYEDLIEFCRHIKSDQVRCYAWSEPAEEAGFARRWLTETKNMKFETLTVRAPKDTHGFLVRSFGEDYMIPPAEAERVQRHRASFIDFGGNEC